MVDDEARKEDGLRSEIDAGKLSPDEGHTRKIERYAKAKTRALKVSEHIISQYPEKFKTGDKVKQCGTFLVFWHFYTIDQYRLARSNFCKKHLFCGLCAILRAAKQLQSYLEKVRSVLDENPGMVLILVTLTVKNGPDLIERFNHLQSNYRRMVQRRRNLLKGGTRDKLQTVFRYFHGAVATYEFTNKGKGWHPHLHMICAVDAGLDVDQVKRELKREWETLTKDSHQCDARSISADNEDDMLGAFCEVFKYSLKMNDMKIEDQVHAGFTLHKTRLIASFGVFYGVQVPEDLEDGIEEDLSLLPYVELIYRYSDTFGYQIDQAHQHENHLPSQGSYSVEDKAKVDRKNRALDMIQETNKGTFGYATTAD
jgi:plasmid rolling circle replication initiator protein Rep